MLIDSHEEIEMSEVLALDNEKEWRKYLMKRLDKLDERQISFEKKIYGLNFFLFALVQVYTKLQG